MVKRTTAKSDVTTNTSPQPRKKSAKTPRKKSHVVAETPPPLVVDASGSVPFADEDIPVPKTLEAWEKVKPLVEGIPESALLPLRYPATEATLRGLWLASNAKRDLSQFERIYNMPPVEAISLMETAALAVKGAERTSLASTRQLSSEEIQRSRNLRERALCVVGAVFFGNAEVEAELDRIRAGSGHQDLGNDLLDLAALISKPKYWKKLAQTGLVTEADIKDLENAGMAILEWVGSRPKTKRTKKINPSPRLLEQRAWTYMAELYDLIRDHAYVIHRKDFSVWERDYPNLLAFTWSPKSPAKTSPAGTTNAGSGPGDGQPTTSPATDPSSTANPGNPQTTPPGSDSSKK